MRHRGVDDLIGKKINGLTVIEQCEDYVAKNGQHQTRCLCQCDCGNYSKIVASVLRRGAIKSCGCIKLERNPKPVRNDLTGQRFGRLLVLERAERYRAPCGTALTQYKCICDCGKEVIVKSDSLMKGVTKSCGCLAKENAKKRLLVGNPGEKYGTLTLIRRLDTMHNGCYEWECLCDCGNVVVKQIHTIRSAKFPSCGCASQSHGERLIMAYLNAHNVKYLYNKSIRPFVNIDTRLVSRQRFDFLLIDVNNKVKLVVEYDGIQHFSFCEYWHNNSENAFNAYHRDDNKTYFCQNNKIPLLRIKYTQINIINDILDFALQNVGFFKNRFNPYLTDLDYFENRTIQIDNKDKMLFIDHEGNGFPTKEEMCHYWGVSVPSYTSRMKSGNYTLKEALTLPCRYRQVDSNNIRCRDHLENEFVSITAMAKHYGIERKTLTGRLKSGWALKDALTIKPVVGRNQTFYIV